MADNEDDRRTADVNHGHAELEHLGDSSSIKSTILDTVNAHFV